MTGLNDLIADEAIELDVTVSNWEEAIAYAGGLLEKSGAISSEYTQSMIESVEDNGPYIVLAPGFAFAHARPTSAVNRTALSWIRLAKPVEFGHKSNDPVTLVAALAAQDDSEHRTAMAQLARLLAKPILRQRLEEVTTVEQMREIFAGQLEKRSDASKASAAVAPTEEGSGPASDEETVASKGKVLTVCGNGLGTSLFLKNTLDEVLVKWGWDKYVTVEATDTISAKGRAKEADFILTSGEIAKTLGDVGVPVHVIENFTSEAEIDSALRQLYAV